MDAEKLSVSSNFHIRTVRSSPEETICVEDENFAALMDDVWPPCAAEGDVANTSEDMLQTRSSPS